MAMPCNATELIPARQNPPKDGLGPRGAPDCYYTSRVLDSTARYVKFVRKLRALEEEQRKGAANTLKELNDKQNSDFFIRCDRRSLINNVARRVDLCLASYQEDLKAKRQRLLNLLTLEEEANIRKFVEQAQAGAAALWQDKKDRLAYLLAKRQKEHEEKYRDPPISKFVHVHPCIVKYRAREAQEAQLYQMKEKQARKMAEMEIDKMWHEVALKESEALAARMELDAIERLRRNQECVRSTDEQIRLKNERRQKEKEMLKLETMRMMAEFEEQNRKEAEENRQHEIKRHETARERLQMIKERKETLGRQQAEEKLISDTWDSLAGQSLAEDLRKKQRIKQRRAETEVCNQKMKVIKQDKLAMQAAEDAAILEEGQRLQDEADMKRCLYAKRRRQGNMDCRDAVLEQIKEKAEKEQRLRDQKNLEYDEYQRQLKKQLDELVAHKELTEAQARKLHQKNLQQQIEYNKLLKERIKEEELEQRKKYKIATDQYHQDIVRIMSQAIFSDEVHPFKKPMQKGLQMREKCPCSKPDHCALPVLNPKGAPEKDLKGGPTKNPQGAPGTVPKT
ncbi:hypothetical protein PYW08_010017 [Mythimna loreyi]|uniref:Uncharacterized protein n=1 Tax=Mythimna loreyi TaxID=667449 RepID=A0ACC2Q8X7_9NEOP|nr:hypothetical protein PYW08_010017 [Mythimna loreyi]